MRAKSPYNQAFEFIGLCLAPADGARRELIEAGARAVQDWPLVYRLAESRYVLPLVHQRLKESGVLNLVPAETATRGRELFERVTAINTLRLHEILVITTRLAEEGVPTLFFKGAALLFDGIYPKPGLRMMSDVDLLIRPEHREKSRAVMSGLRDWTLRPKMKDVYWEEDVYYNPAGFIIELHHALKPIGGVDSGHLMSRMWEGAREVDWGGRKAMIPSLNECVSQAGTHATSHHIFNTAILFIMAADISAILAAGAPDWASLASDLGEERMLEHMAIALEVTQLLVHHPSVRRGLEDFYAESPATRKAVADFLPALMPMMFKPWVTYSGGQMHLFTERSRRKRLTMLYEGFRRRMAAGALPSEPAQPRAGGVVAPPVYQKKFFDLDSIRFMYRLYRFYRQIDYKPPQ